MTMLRAFESEMRRLSDGGEELARCYPEQGRMLSLAQSNDRDPYVERLLEGVAYLTAGVRQELQHAFADLHEQLLEALSPQLVDPFPSTVTLDLGLDMTRIEGADIPAGSVFYSQPGGEKGLRFPFLAQLPIKLRPFAVEYSHWEPLPCGDSQVRLLITGTPAAFRDTSALSSLLLNIDAGPGLSYALREALLRGLQEVELRPWREELTSAGLRQGKKVFFEPAFPLPPSDLFGLPLPGSPALERLQAFFLAREQLLFLTLRGLEQANLPNECHGIEMICRLARKAPHAAGSRNDMLRYGCIPAINLNRDRAEPVRLAAGTSEFLVRSDADGPGSRVVQRVLQVEGRDVHSGKVTTYSPLATWGLAEDRGGLYSIVRRDRGSAGRGDPQLRLNSPSAQLAQTVAAEVLYSNGDLPRLYLSKGQIDSCSAQLPEGVIVNNRQRPRTFWAAPVEAGQKQVLASLLRSDFERLADGQVLRNLLASVAFSDKGHELPVVQAIGDVQWQTTSRWRKGVIEHGIRVTMPLDIRHLPDRGQACLLAELVHGVLFERAPLDRFVELVLVFEPSGEEEQWTSCR